MSTDRTISLAEAKKLAETLMAGHALTGWAFEFDNAKRRAGVCKYRIGVRSGVKGGVIGLSRHFVRANTAAEVTNTILHEIAHALTPGDGHGWLWKAKCVEVGAKPVRCYDAPGSGRSVVMPAGKYQATCPGCKRLFHLHRRPKAGRTRWCRSCGQAAGTLTYSQGQ